jgi:hypothetical protein
MQNKTNRWLDVQIVIASLALTFSLALWNLFAGGSRPVSTVTASSQRGKAAYAPSAATAAPALQASSPIYLGGAAPQPPSYNAPAAPAPVTITSSSRP